MSDKRFEMEIITREYFNIKVNYSIYIKIIVLRGLRFH